MAMVTDLATFGVFPDRASFESAVDALRAAEFRASDISAVLPDRGHTTRDLAHEIHTKAPEGIAAGAGTGAAVGGVLGWLVGVGAIAIPGVGPLIAAGPIVAALAGAGAAGAAGDWSVVWSALACRRSKPSATPAASATGATCCRCIATTRNGRHARVKSLLPRAPRRLSALPKPNPIIGREALLTPFGRGEAGGGLDLADLQDVALLVGGDEQDPLVRVTPLPRDQMAPQIVFRSHDVLPQPIVMGPVLGDERLERAHVGCRELRRDGLLPVGPIDPVPQNVRVRISRREIARSRRQRPL